MKKSNNEKNSYPAFLLLIFLCGILGTSNAKTRWSSLHVIPDADFLAAGHFVVDLQGFTFADSAKGQLIRPTGIFSMGIMEWVNLEMGYAGGPTVGFKARIFGETSNFLPSLAVGARDILCGKEMYYFNAADTLKNALFISIAKSVDPLKLRIHGGVQTFLASDSDRVDPFIGLEEYFGQGLYVTIEVERLKNVFVPSLFVSWRLLKKKLELSAGAVAINKLFFDKNNKFNINIATPSSSGFARPGFWIALRYNGFLRMGKMKAFSSSDDQLKSQGEYIESLRRQIDSIKTTLAENMTRLAKVDNSIITLSDSIYSDRNRLKAALYDKLVALKILYESEPFEPEVARQAISRIVAIKDNALPVMKEFVTDKKQDRKIRMLGISLIGEMGGTGASDALLDVLSQSEDPDIKIEILIALGKMKETRALYVMEQLANDPTDVVAFTAQEVLMKIVRDKGIKLSSDFKMRPISMADTSAIKVEKIPVERTKKTERGGEAASSRFTRQETASAKAPFVPPAASAASVEAGKGQTPGVAKEKEKAPDTVNPATTAHPANKDTQDIWGMQGADKDSLTKKQATGDRIKPDTGRGVQDSAAVKSGSRPAPSADTADSAMVKPAAAAPKKEEKNEPVKDARKTKPPKKKTSPFPEDEKGW
jgi:hypothetical protein